MITMTKTYMQIQDILSKHGFNFYPPAVSALIRELELYMIESKAKVEDQPIQELLNKALRQAICENDRDGVNTYTQALQRLSNI